MLSALSVSAQKYQHTWDGGGSNNKYENAENWSSNRLPAPQGKLSMSLLIDEGTMIFDDLSGKQVIDLLDVSSGAVLKMKGGHLEHARAGNNVRSSVGISGGGVSIVEHTGGRMSIGHMLRIGDKKSRGQYNLTDGILEVFRGGVSLTSQPHQPSITVGTGGSESEFSVSGGALYTRAGIEIGTNSTFAVKGNDAKAIAIGALQVDNPGTWYQSGTLSCGVGPRGITKIYVALSEKSEQFVRFAKGSKLDLNFYGTRPINGTWVLLELQDGHIEDEGLELTKATSENPGWTFEIDNSGPNGRLIAKYKHYVGVPELRQYSLVLSLLLGVLVMARRKRL